MSLVARFSMDLVVSKSTLRWSAIESVIFVWTNEPIRERKLSLWGVLFPRAPAALLALNYISTCLLIVSPSTLVRIYSRMKCSIASYTKVRIPACTLRAAV